MVRELCNNDDVIDSRDIIERIEELEAERDRLTEAVEKANETLAEKAEEQKTLAPDDDREYSDALDEANAAKESLSEWFEGDEGTELKTLQAIAEEGESATSEWPHGETLIRESYFTEHMEEQTRDIGDLPKELPWYLEDAIDWEKVAKTLRADYSEVDFDGVTYLIRSN